MSDTPTNNPGVFDIPAILVELDRKRAETQKFVAEQGKLQAEARKFNRDPWMLIAGAIIAGISTRLPEILHALGWAGH